MDRLLKWLEPPIHLLMWTGLIASVLMMSHESLEVVGRYLDHPLPGTTEIVSAYYMIAVAYLPWAYIARNDNHIVADIFTRAIPPKAMFWVEIAIKILTLAYVSVFAWQTVVRALQQMRAGEAMQIHGGYLPVWPSRWVLPIAAGMMAIYLLVRIIRDVANGAEAEPPKPTQETAI